MDDTVEFTRLEYLANIVTWQLVADACAGERAVKARGEQYLPRPNIGDQSSDANNRYAQYLSRAVYYNATGRTLSSLIGLAFTTWPEFQSIPSIEYLDDDADGASMPLVQHSGITMAEVLKTGRAGLLVDFPQPSDAPEDANVTSIADMLEYGIRATINFYPAHTIINWRSERFASVQKLTLVVIREIENNYSNFGYTADAIYRVLRLQDGVYTQEVWKKDLSITLEDGKHPYILHSVTTPLDANGKPWREIPFTFVGAVNNSPDVESHLVESGWTPYSSISPLYDIAVLNLAHYRNSADFEDSAFICGQPQPYMTGLSEEWRDMLVKQGITLGARAVLPLPVGATFGLAQASANPLILQAMTQKEEQMAALGAKLVQRQKAARTATQAVHEQSNDNSVLSLACDNVSTAYTRALGWCVRFMGGDEEAVSYSINTESFFGNSIDGPTVQAVVQAWQSGAVPEADMWSALRRMAVIDPSKSDDDIRAELAAVPSQTMGTLPAQDLSAALGTPPSQTQP